MCTKSDGRPVRVQCTPDTTVQGIQIAITIFLLVMAALMIPGGKLTDRYGRKRLFMLGLIVYAVGAVLGALAPGLGVLIIGNSIPAAVHRPDIPGSRVRRDQRNGRDRRRSRCADIGGLITAAISWRAAFIFQAWSEPWARSRACPAACPISVQALEPPLPLRPSGPMDSR
jgi:MFS family permease